MSAGMKVTHASGLSEAVDRQSIYRGVPVNRYKLFQCTCPIYPLPFKEHITLDLLLQG